MEAITATVQEVLNVNEFEGKHGLIHYYKVKMDNGQTGSIGRKRKDLESGSKLTYTVEEGEYGLKFKIVPPATNGNGYTPRSSTGSTRSFALSYAKDLGIAFVTRCDKNETLTMDGVADRVIQIADRFDAWLREAK